jgi:hypothetical protein
MIRLLQLLHHHQLHPIHYTICSRLMLCIYARSHEAGVRNSRGAKFGRERWSTSNKLRGYQPSFRSRQALVYLSNALVFYFEALLYTLLCLCIKFI